MGQSRNKTGVEFENSICESKGWQRVSKSPKIKWTGKGRSNFEKIASVNFNPDNFLPLPNSIFDKYDAITENGERVELKKYKISKLKDWTLYSEPIFKVASREDVSKVTRIFGQGSLEKAIEVYNQFVSGIVGNIGQDILDKITQSNIGIQLEDGFIPQSKLEYRWIVRKGWANFDRLSIEFRVKN